MPFKLKQLLFVSILFIIGCKSSTVNNLYDKNSALYNSLKKLAAAKCVNETPIFKNLKATSFLNYPILTQGSNEAVLEDRYIKIADDYFIAINTLTASAVTFTVIGVNTNSFAKFLDDGTYTISLEENNKIVDVMADGVCSESFTGDEDASDTKLDFSVTRYFIEDSTAIESNTTPGEFESRVDTFSMSSSVPAFLFLWGGKYQTFKKDENDTTAQSTSSFSADLSLTVASKQNCVDNSNFSESDCTNTSTVIELDMPESASSLSSIRGNSNDSILKGYYFTDFPASR